MASVNKVIIIGNVGKDPELRYNPSGGAWVTLSLATTRNWKTVNELYSMARNLQTTPSA